MKSRISIVLASVLKPVNDTRIFEKFGLSLSQTNKYDINIIGFEAKNIKKVQNICFYPIFKFERISFNRFFAPFILLNYLFKVKPKVVIFNTPELLCVILLYKVLFRCRVIYDIQENYFRNIVFNKNYLYTVRWLMGYLVKVKEWSARTFIDRVIFAEEGYEKEMPRWARKAVVIKNTYRNLSDIEEQLIDPSYSDKSDSRLKDNELLPSKAELTGKAHSGLNNNNEKPVFEDFKRGIRYDYDKGRQDEKVKSLGEDYHQEENVNEKHKRIKNLIEINQQSKNLIKSNKWSEDPERHSHTYKDSEKNHILMGDYPGGKRKPADKLTIIYTGTISENYGIFRAINFINAFHKVYPFIHLIIAGYCANQKVFKRVKMSIEGKDYIHLFGGDGLVPHEEIIRYIQMSDFGLICYKINPSTENCFPTKIYEYMANKLPIIIQDYKPWSSYCLNHDAAVEVNFDHLDYEELLALLSSRPFYRNGIPEEIFWQQDEKKLLQLMDDIQS